MKYAMHKQQKMLNGVTPSPRRHACLERSRKVAVPALSEVERSPCRDSGQGLILAVLVLILIALFGAAFIAVVASNINSAGSFQDKGDARSAAQRAREFANLQLVKSDQGLDWRPQTPKTYTNHRLLLLNAAPATDPPTEYTLPIGGNTLDPDFNTYYDEFERLRGFTSLYNNTAAPFGWVRRFVKYPDPLSALAGLESSDTAAYLLEVKYPAIISGIARPQVEVHTVGRSRANSATFHELRAYKPVVLFDNLRYVSNFDYRRKVVPSTTLLAIGAGRSAITVAPGPGFETTGPLEAFTDTNVNGVYDAGELFTDSNGNGIREPVYRGYIDANKHISIFDPSVSATPEIRMVIRAGVNAAGNVVLFLDFPLSLAHTIGSRVEVASALGQPTYPGSQHPTYLSSAASDFIGGYGLPGAGPTFPPPSEIGHINELAVLPAGNPFTTAKGSEHVFYDAVGGVFSNGSLLLHGFNLFRLDNIASEPLYSVSASGLMAVDHAVAFDASHPAIAGVKFLNSGAAEVTVGGSGDTTFPDPTVAAQTMVAKAWRDGFGRITGNASATMAQRQVQPITPPDITTSGEDGMARYRKQTAFADVVGNPAGSARFGFGRGLYINNPGDVEMKTIPEPFIDTNGNGVYDAGEPFTDLNGDGVRDAAAVPFGYDTSVATVDPRWRLEDLKDLWMKRTLTSSNPVRSSATPGSQNYSFEAIGQTNTGAAGGTTLHVGDTFGYVTPPTVGSLENRHLRGWVSDSEFLPRGAHIELIPNMSATKLFTFLASDTNATSPGMIIAMDELSDARAGAVPYDPTTGTGPYDPSTHGTDTLKQWRNATGTRMGTYYRIVQYANVQTGPNTEKIAAPVYKARFYDPLFALRSAPFNGDPWTAWQPFNRVVFAEGNIRIRGTLSGATTDDGFAVGLAHVDLMVSLTVVSMGTIYIEGDLREPQSPPLTEPDFKFNPPLGRIALLANYHVTVNPTQIMPRAHAVAPVIDPPPAGTGALELALGNNSGLGKGIGNSGAFRMNDIVVLWKRAAGPPVTFTQVFARVTSALPTAKTLTVAVGPLTDTAGTYAVEIANHPTLGMPADILASAGPPVVPPDFRKIRKGVGGRAFEPLGGIYAARSRNVQLQDSFDNLGTFAPRLDAAFGSNNVNQVRVALGHGGGSYSMPTNGATLPYASTDGRDTALSVQYTQSMSPGTYTSTFQVKLDDRRGPFGSAPFPERHSDILIEANAGAAAPYIGKYIYVVNKKDGTAAGTYSADLTTTDLATIITGTTVPPPTTLPTTWLNQTSVGYTATLNVPGTILGQGLAAFTNIPLSPGPPPASTPPPLTFTTFIPPPPLPPPPTPPPPPPSVLVDPDVPFTVPLATAIQLHLLQPTATSMFGTIPHYMIGSNRFDLTTPPALTDTGLTLGATQGTGDFIVSADEKFYRIANYAPNTSTPPGASGTWTQNTNAPWFANEVFPSMFGNNGTISATIDASVPAAVLTRMVLAFDEDPAGSTTWHPNMYRLSRFKVEGFHTPSPGFAPAPPGYTGDDLVQSAILYSGGISGNASLYTAGATPSPVPTAGAAIEINAIVYAQQGSWFVIPSSYYDRSMIPGQLATSIVAGTAANTTDVTIDLTALDPAPAAAVKLQVPVGSWMTIGSDGGLQYAGASAAVPPGSEGRFVIGASRSGNVVTMTVMPALTGHVTGELVDVNLDFNRDGYTTNNERSALIRFLRYNYSITFRGSISENSTAPNLVDATGGVADVRDWTDKWSYPVATTPGLAAPFFRSIRYTYDTKLGPNGTIITGATNVTLSVIPPMLPATPDLIEASG